MPTEGLSCSDCLEPTITEYLHDSYQLTVTNDYGCITTITIHVREKKLTSVNIPNIFSPSSRDGNNDYFTLYGNENVVLINEMYVYDRWGNLVYSNNNFLPNDPYQGWDCGEISDFGVPEKEKLITTHTHIILRCLPCLFSHSKPHDGLGTSCPAQPESRVACQTVPS